MGTETMTMRITSRRVDKNERVHHSLTFDSPRRTVDAAAAIALTLPIECPMKIRCATGCSFSASANDTFAPQSGR